MNSVSVISENNLKSQLHQALGQYVSDDEISQVVQFSDQFYSFAALEELKDRRISDLAGATISSWRMLMQHDAKSPTVRVYNPDFERHGWQSPHTVVEMVCPQAPFLINSIRMELNNRGYNIHTLQTAVFDLKLGEVGGAVELSTNSSDFGSSKIAVAFFEIDRCSSSSELRSIEVALVEVLAEVRLVDADLLLMKIKLNELSASLGMFDPNAQPSELDETRAFFDWMLKGHFTFLGYEEFKVISDSSLGRIEYDESSFLGVSRRLHSGLDSHDLKVRPEVKNFLTASLLLSFAKSSYLSRVRRATYADYVSLREIDSAGNVVKEHRFIGLFYSHGQSVRDIPCIRKKVAQVEERSGYGAESHLGQELARILEALPRDDLYQSSVDELFPTVISIAQIQERFKVRAFFRTDPYDRFFYCLTYVPREIYSTEIRLKIQQVLMAAVGAQACEFWTVFSESVLARVQFILPLTDHYAVTVDYKLLEQQVIQACRSWQDEYASLTVESFGEANGTNVLADFPKGFPAGYRERFAAYSAVVDMQHLLNLTEANPLVMSFYQPLGQVSGQRELHCKLYHADTPLALSDVLPILENLGLRVLGEFPYRLRHNNGRELWIHDFAFTAAEGLELDIQQLNDTLQDAFVHIVRGDAENDAFNRLVLTAGLPWRDVALLRAYARYMKQIRLGFDLGYIASTLNNHADIARELTRLFKTRFYLARKLDSEDLEDKQQRLEHAILSALDDVQVLNEDRILRRYLDLIKATLRTNFYQTDLHGQNKSYFSFKFNPHQIPELPKPVPKFEIFVYSPRVEGVHLRFGNVARGGLRWSDREEDFRTEVLGLVKAQQVKNSVIVPVGAKGGFLPRRLPLGGSRDEIAAEGIACYRIFISGLLDITDNLKDGALVPPANVVRHDDDDPYLVVAADKGTATFSDIANGIAIDYGFWLGDAFASGGSAGYDHKKMGITAKGAWVGVQRHFRERGINVQEDSITVVGVGDMAGDVFGNGLLMSDKLQLVAAFNHLHIFIDPNPNPATSFAERQRLFDLPRSAWSDYDTSIMSEGGGIFSRSAKSIAISPQMQERFDIQADKLTPTELLNALLKAPVDLLWNGGIGTYVKASSESHADVGDKANDALRVNGNELRCKVVGEGGNLGMTQLGRVEFGLNGGGSNTDFIDNAGGVDCSDHEVNIKILLNEVVQAGDMTDKQRNQLLASMTDEVGGLVLGNNYKQTQALSLAARRALPRIAEYKRLMNDLEGRGKLDRAIEFLPSEDQINERVAAGHGLTRAELSVLISYSKIDLKEQLLGSLVPDDAYLTRDMEGAFPSSLVSNFGEAMRSHRLKREIVSNQIANDLVNNMGITFVQSLCESTGKSPADVVEAYVIVRDVFHLPHWFHQVEALDYQVPVEIQFSLMDELIHLCSRATRWFLRSRRNEQDAARDVIHFGPHIAALGLELDDLLQGQARDEWGHRYHEFVQAGVPELLARLVAGADHLYNLLPAIEASGSTTHSPAEMVKAFFAAGSALELNWYLQELGNLPAENNWQSLARESLRDDADKQLSTIVMSIMKSGSESSDGAEATQVWVTQNAVIIDKWIHLIDELKSAPKSDWSMYTVANIQLMSLSTI
ncbi:NAD-glutamate dehydrogenase [Pseudomonas sp. NFX224]|uniref:NAD-glutamate dehydrogenase n=1 Tax=Pseudomonas sp. NFX224 TaxID=3402862 RepID=UPI003AFA2B41